MSGEVFCYLPGHQGRNVIDSTPDCEFLYYVCGCFPAPVKPFYFLLSRKEFVHERMSMGKSIDYNLTTYLEMNAVKFKMYGIHDEDLDMCHDYLETDIKFEDLSSPAQASRQEIKEGLELDVVDFLSSHGKTKFLVSSDGLRVPIEVVRNRNLLICCVDIPLPTASMDADCLRAMIDANSEAKRCGNDFQMVVVANMKNGFAHSEGAFNHFFSKLNCLAIPFSDYETRNYICSSIGLNIKLFSTDISAIVVNERGTILWDDNKARIHFQNYGCEKFRFRDETVDAIRIQDDVLRMRLDPLYVISPDFKISSNAMKDPQLQVPLSLYADILLCDRNRILRRCHLDGGPAESVSELSNKYVGLYLCFDGEFMEKLHEVHQQCIVNKQQLEIVVVFMAIFDDTNAYSKDLWRVLELFNIKTWFVFHYDPVVCRRLWRVFGKEETTDRLIIIPPNCKSGEMEGRAFINQLERYPFTRSSFKERKVKYFKTINPLAVFKRIYSRDSDLTPSDLEGKKLLLYFDFVHCIPREGGFCHLLKKHYPKIQAKGWEVVFVPMFENKIGPFFNTDMPWPIMPLPVAETLVSNLVDLESYGRRLMAVGEDGVIRSRFGENRLEEYEDIDSVFNDNLYEEMADRYANLEDEDE